MVGLVAGRPDDEELRDRGDRGQHEERRPAGVSRVDLRNERNRDGQRGGDRRSQKIRGAQAGSRPADALAGAGDPASRSSRAGQCSRVYLSTADAVARSAASFGRAREFQPRPTLHEAAFQEAAFQEAQFHEALFQEAAFHEAAFHEARSRRRVPRGRVPGGARLRRARPARRVEDGPGRASRRRTLPSASVRVRRRLAFDVASRPCTSSSPTPAEPGTARCSRLAVSISAPLTWSGRPVRMQREDRGRRDPRRSARRTTCRRAGCSPCASELSGPGRLAAQSVSVCGTAPTM